MPVLSLTASVTGVKILGCLREKLINQGERKIVSGSVSNLHCTKIICFLNIQLYTCLWLCYISITFTERIQGDGIVTDAFRRSGKMASTDFQATAYYSLVRDTKKCIVLFSPICYKSGLRDFPDPILPIYKEISK